MTAFLPGPAWWPVLLPALAAAGLALLPRLDWARRLGPAASAATLLLVAGLLAAEPATEGLLRADAANLPLALLAAVLGLAAALVAEPDPVRARRRHAAAQAVQAGTLLALLADDLALAWAGIEAAVLAGALLATGDRRAAAWRMLLPCGVGLGLALFGTVLLHVAASGTGAGLSWAALRGAAARLDPGLLNLAWAFLLLGYGAVAGLAPWHGWAVRVRAGASPAAAMLLAGLLPVAALHVLARAGAVVAAHPGALRPGHALLGLGLATVLLAGLGLWRRPAPRRLLAWAGTGGLGLATVGFGLGGAAVQAAQLQLGGYALCHGAAALALGRGSGAGEASSPRRWVLVLGLAALAGLPPSAPFFSGLPVVAEAARRPWTLLLLGPGMVLAATALVGAMGALRPGPGAAPALAWALLGLAAVLGLALPAALAGMLAEGARLLG